MVKFFLFSIIVMITSCQWQHESKGSYSGATLEAVAGKRDFYCDKALNIYKYLERCDGATFIGLYNAYCRGDEIYDHEYSYEIHGDMSVAREFATGQLNRDVMPCFELDLDDDGYTDSRSGCSFESIVGPLHAFWAKGDGDALMRVYEYAKANKWTFGAGPSEYTYLPHLYFLLSKMVEDLTFVAADDDDAMVASVLDKLEGYRGKVIALYLDLKSRVYGYLNPLEMELLETLLEKDDDNPIYTALWWRHRGEAKYLDKTLAYLMREETFPSDKLPGRLRHIDWGDDAGFVVYAWIVSILEHQNE